MNSVAKTIRNSRENLGLTQEELAEKSQVNLRTIQRIENNESEPRGKTLRLIYKALGIEHETLIGMEEKMPKKIGTQIVDWLFLFAFNLILMAIIGYLTFDSNANLNSRFGGILVSVFLPLFIVSITPKMSSLERILKFGFGYVLYFILVMIFQNFPAGFITGLFPCLLISLTVLYFGNNWIKREV